MRNKGQFRWWNNVFPLLLAGFGKSFVTHCGGDACLVSLLAPVGSLELLLLAQLISLIGPLDR